MLEFEGLMCCFLGGPWAVVGHGGGGLRGSGGWLLGQLEVVVGG